jgi:hypothetical protein
VELSQLIDFAEHHAGWIAVVSVAMLVLGALAAPWLICRLPSDYFQPEHRRRLSQRGPVPPIYWPWVVVRNVLGAVLILLGLIMFVTPGQGALTLFAGLWLTNFPGKYRLERRLVAVPGVLGAINWIRRRRRLPEMTPPSG